VRVLIWHGWLLEGSGSNVSAARVTESLRRAGHDVLLLCQARPEAAPTFIDELGSVGPEGVANVTPNSRAVPDPGGGKATLLRPDIGRLLPVFVIDEYAGFDVKRFVDLTSEELDHYLERNVVALRRAVQWHRSDLVIASHVVPGGVVAARAVGEIPFVLKTHGSELEYAVRLQRRYADLANEALERASKVAGGSQNVLDRALAFAPSAAPRAAIIPPGVDGERFRPRPRRPSLEEAAAMLDGDAQVARGRPEELSAEVKAAIGGDPETLARLARRYDQDAPDRAAAQRLRRLARFEGPIVAYLGKLIPEKGVELLIQALALEPGAGRGLIIGFGLHREWLEALVGTIVAGGKGLGWIRAHAGLQIELEPKDLAEPTPESQRVTFTGRLDHRYAPLALAAADVLVVPSVIPEAFAMVTVEGAAAGCLPLVARHSGLAEVAATLEEHVGRPGAFGFEPGPGAIHRLAAGVSSLLSLPPEERARLRQEVSAFARATWTWDRMAEQLIATGTEAAGKP
jgi:glycosyltransferase involved in cell wall biosynthesis